MLKRYIMEFLGTFFLMFAISSTGNAFAIGFLLMAAVFIGVPVSGGHFNPAVTAAMWVRGFFHDDHRIDILDMVLYWASQIAGAFVAVGMYKMVTQQAFMPDVTPVAPVHLIFTLEGLFTLLFCWVFLTTIFYYRYRQTAIFGPAIGLTYMAVLFLGRIANPAVLIASGLCSLWVDGTFLSLQTIAIYVLAPLLGGIAATCAAHYFDDAH